jgi:hypothetical protein
MEKRRRILPLLNVGATGLTIVVNALSNTSIISSKNVGEISDLYPTLFTPAGYVFAIWGVIYMLLVIFTVYQSLPSQRTQPFINQIGYWYILSSVVNSLWIVLWVNEFIVLSTIMMGLLLISLILIYLRLDIGSSKPSLPEQLAVQLPFSIYLGWITVATIGNVAVALTALGWDGWGVDAASWMVVMLGIALIVTLLVIVTRKDIGYSLVVIWALLGIIVKNLGDITIVLTAGIGIGLIILTTIIQKVR